MCRGWCRVFCMTTYALELSQLLAVANRHTVKTDKFLDVISEHLGFIGPQSRTMSTELLVKLVNGIEYQIEELPHDEGVKQVARKQLSPFKGIQDFSQIHLNIDNAKRNFLNSDHLVGLTNLHMALSGHFNQPNFPSDAKKLAEKFRSMEKEIPQTELPEEAIRAIQERIQQITVLLENANAFGPEKIKREIEALMGAIFVNAPQTKGKTKEIVATVFGLALGSLVFHA